MFRVEELEHLREGLSLGYINLDEYYEMLNLLN
jgi:hypothetical protein